MMRLTRLLTALALPLTLLPALCLLATAASADSLPQEERVQGGIALVPLPADAPADVQVWSGPHRVWVLPEDGGMRLAIVGIPLGARDKIELRLRSDGSDSTLPVALTPKTYKEQHLTVSQEFVTPDTSQLDRYKREAAEQAAVYLAFHPTAKGWPQFRLPVDGTINPTSFGSQRFFNNEPRAPHSGMDIGAPEGANVWAPADGVVARTGAYFFNGNTVMIDHGNGLVSMLCHLSKIIATPGQHVKAGDIVGLVGHTGRVTAPHLHWGVSLNDARVNPALVLPESLRATAPATSP
jgi:murein DD-endopeptidase MepM/ murein hydrolase activator NlpD